MEAILFTTTNNTFGPTKISYLEHKFCNLATNAKRYKIANAPNPDNNIEGKESDLQDFIEKAKIMMGVLGHKVLEPIISSIRSTEESEPFYI